MQKLVPEKGYCHYKILNYLGLPLQHAAGSEEAEEAGKMSKELF